MKSIAQKSRNVSSQFCQREPTTAEFIRLNPLPRSLAYLKPVLLKLPLDLIMELVFGGAEMGATEAKLIAGIKAAAKHYEQDNHRCGACFEWTDKEHAFAVILNGEYHFSACCEKCQQKIHNGTATQAMQKNMRASLLDGAG